MDEEVVRVLSWTVCDRGAHEVRSAGTQRDGDGRPVRRADLDCADVVCVMEPVHADFIRRRWPLSAGQVRVLGIPDVYHPGDLALRDLLAADVLARLREAA